MIFHKKERENMDDIKDVISEQTEPPYEDEIEPPYYDDKRNAPDLRSAPLFVKVERYKNVLSLLQEMKVFVSGIKNLFNILQELDNLRIDAIKITRATVQRLERRLIEIDNELLRPRGYEVQEEPPVETEAHDLDDSLTDLQRELTKLKSELEDLK